MPTWVQDPETGEMVPKQEWLERQAILAGTVRAHAVLKDIEAFVSPIDKRVITGRKALREHNAAHGVTNIQDYGPEYFARKDKERGAIIQGRTPQAKRERVEAIKRAISEGEKT